jgi:Protein of unknown function (DUF3103)
MPPRDSEGCSRLGQILDQIKVGQISINLHSEAQGKVHPEVDMLKWKLLGSVFVSITMLAACNSSPQAPVQSGDGQIDSNLDQMARIFAQSMSDASLREAIKGAAIKRFDGDTEVLYKDLAAQQLNAGQTVQQRLSLAYQQQTQGTVSALSLETASAQLSALAQTSPRLQVAVRGNIQSWDAKAETPLVAVAVEGAEDITLTQVRAYDSQGQVHTLDAQKDPERPVIVIGLNERTDETGKLLSDFKPAKASGAQAQPAPTESSSTLSLSAIAPQGCQGNYWENMYQVHIRDKKEPWTRGAPDVRLKVSTPKNKRGVYDGDFISVDETNRWYFYNRDLFYWTDANNGPWIEYFWYESDGGAPKTYKVSVSYKGVTATVEFPVGNGDDIYGWTTVTSDNRLKYTHHDLGGIEWYRYAYANRC